MGVTRVQRNPAASAASLRTGRKGGRALERSPEISDEVKPALKGDYMLADGRRAVPAFRRTAGPGEAAGAPRSSREHEPRVSPECRH